VELSVKRHLPIVADDKELIRPDLFLGHIPVATTLQIRFRERMSIYDKNTVPEGQPFPGQAQNSLKQHNPSPRQANSHDISPARLAKSVTQSIDKIDGAITISGFHTPTIDTDRQKYKLEHQKANKGQDRHAPKGAPGRPA
jgi:hypothetical protein